MALRKPRTRSEQGAVALEAGLLGTVLFPLMIGVLFWGNYFWHAQKVNLEAARLDPNQIVGVNFTCQQLVDRVEQEVLNNIQLIGGDSLSQVGLNDITATVAEVLPTVGAYINVQIRVPVVNTMSSMLPYGGDVVDEVSFRLENVTLTTKTCT